MSRIATSRPRGSASPGERPVRARRLEATVAAGALALLVVAGLIGGADALAGAAVGLVLVVVFLLTGRLPVVVQSMFSRGVAFLVLGINYLFRVVLLLVALVALRDETWLDPRVLGLVVIAGALAWNVVTLRRHLAGNARKDAEPLSENDSEKESATAPVIGGGER